MSIIKPLKKTLAIHDISCVGKCSITVALPVISAAGIETSVIPTAVLSTHTGGFENYTYRDLTSDILPIVKHWETLPLSFDSIYTGYLGSFEQIRIVEEVIDRLKEEKTLVLVDPVMADHGMLYASFPDTFPAEMRKLCAKADVLVPNITEAALLLDIPYVEGVYKKDYIEKMLYGLSELGARQVVLTGVYFDENQLGAACYDAQTGIIDYAFAPRIQGMYHGSGDLFASVLLAALLCDNSLLESTRIAVKFTTTCIENTRIDQTEPRFGVRFESSLHELYDLCNPNTK